jgi:hypothetical protein
MTTETRYKISAHSDSRNESCELPESGTFNIHYSREQAEKDASDWANKCNETRFRDASDWVPQVRLIGYGTPG